MGIYSIRAILTSIAFSIASSANAGTFWFPIEGHYPYSSNLIVTAVPDLDGAVGSIKTRLFETGKKVNGCHFYGPNSCSSPFIPGGVSVWAYLKDGGGDWSFDGVLYDDLEGGTGKKWLWYDNHGGYDFISTDMSVTHNIRAVEDGVTCGYWPSLGQICIRHTLPTGTYQTLYTHMKNIPDYLKTNSGVGHTITKWDFLGEMGKQGALAVHLHFATRKVLSPGVYETVDPYGHKPNWPSSTADDPNNPYLWE